MATVRVDVTQRGWSASVVEEVHQRVDTLGVAQVEAVNTITLVRHAVPNFLLFLVFFLDRRLHFFAKPLISRYLLPELRGNKTKKDTHVSVALSSYQTVGTTNDNLPRTMSESAKFV